MSDLQGIRDDLAFMRALAEEGRRAPLVGGSILAAGGLIFGVASLVFYAAWAGVIAVPPAAVWVIWGVPTLLFLGVLFAIKGRVRAAPGAGAPANRAFGAAWSALGFAIFVVIASLVVIAVRAEAPEVLNAISPIILALYGAGWWLAAALSGKRWLGVVSGLSFLAALLCAVLAGRPEMFLVYAAALLGLAFAPGVVLMRAAPSTTV